jgi:hypothetical protein
MGDWVMSGWAASGSKLAASSAHRAKKIRLYCRKVFNRGISFANEIGFLKTGTKNKIVD